MIFDTSNTENPIHIDAEGIGMIARVYVQLRKHAANFVSEKVGESVNEEDISIDEGQVTWKNTYNDSCHCHPHMVTDTHTYSMEDFKAYMSRIGAEFWL